LLVLIGLSFYFLKQVRVTPKDELDSGDDMAAVMFEKGENMMRRKYA